MIARNLQRSRDHGLPSYSEFREFCGLSSLCSWGNRPEEISEANWNRLMTIYDNPDQIELFTGGIAEFPFDGGVVGRTFNCLLSRQFKKLKFGDRFFFTHKNEAGSFTNEQLDNIRKITLGHVICHNTDVPEVRENVFLQEGDMMSCDDVEDIDFDLFVDN